MEPTDPFDPFDQEYLRAPHRWLADARRDRPVFHDPGLDCWVVTRYETVRDVFRDPARFSATVASDALVPLCADAVEVLQAGGVRIPPLLVNNDPPDHQVQRAFLGAPFARRRIAALAPMVRAVVADHVEPLITRDRFDLVRDLAGDVPVVVLLRFLGVPDHDVATLKGWTESRVRLLFGRPEPSEQVRLSHNLVRYYRYAHRFVAGKDPGDDDYTAELLRAVPAQGGDPAEVRHRIAVNVFNLLFAGHETTTAMAANLFTAVLDRPEVWDRLVANPARCAAAVEEAMRFDPSVTAWRRRTTEPVVLDGVAVPAGATVLLMVGAANRDPERFEDPDRFDPDRPDARDHLAFGFGIHHCLGAQLARMELTAMLEELVARFPALHRCDPEPLRYVPNISFRGPEHLRVHQGAECASERACAPG
jgi:cytochrome P450